MNKGVEPTTPPGCAFGPVGLAIAQKKWCRLVSNRSDMAAAMAALAVRLADKGACPFDYVPARGVTDHELFFSDSHGPGYATESPQYDPTSPAYGASSPAYNDPDHEMVEYLSVLPRAINSDLGVPSYVARHTRDFLAASTLEVAIRELSPSVKRSSPERLWLNRVKAAVPEETPRGVILRLSGPPPGFGREQLNLWAHYRGSISFSTLREALRCDVADAFDLIRSLDPDTHAELAQETVDYAVEVKNPCLLRTILEVFGAERLGLIDVEGRDVHGLSLTLAAADGDVHNIAGCLVALVDHGLNPATTVAGSAEPLLHRLALLTRDEGNKRIWLRAILQPLDAPRLGVTDAATGLDTLQTVLRAGLKGVAFDLIAAGAPADADARTPDGKSLADLARDLGGPRLAFAVRFATGESPQAAANAEEGIHCGDECLACCMAPPEVLLDCGHMALCANCASEYASRNGAGGANQGGACSLCRQVSQGAVVFREGHPPQGLL